MGPDMIANALSFIDLNKYLLLLIIMFLEGPIIGFFAGFSASVGFFELWIVLLLAVLGNIIPDTILYFVGRLLRGSAIHKALHFFGLHKRRIKWLENNINKHSVKTLSFIKLVPPLPVPGLILAGFLKVNFKKFFIISLIFNIITGSFFVLLGYLSGIAVNTVAQYLKWGQIILPAALAIGVAVYFLIKYISRKISKSAKNY